MTDGSHNPDAVEMLNGLAIELDEAWAKIISRQFGGEPTRAIGEIIQNFIDAYSPSVAWSDRLARIESTADTVSVTDFGEGMDRDRLQLLTTLGGTDKSGNAAKLGKFGIGFFSIFNPRLGTREVRVVTRCEGHGVELVFTVTAPGIRPAISARRLDRLPEFSTRVTVRFDNPASAPGCIEEAARRLKYCPCPVLINGKRFQNAWQQARHMGLPLFKEGAVEGFLEPGKAGSGLITILCKYEFVGLFSVMGMTRNPPDCPHDLRVYARSHFPFLPGLAMTLNCDTLNLTVSRDSFYLDRNCDQMIAALARAVVHYLDGLLTPHTDPQLIFANQYVLREPIARHLDRIQAGAPPADAPAAIESVVRKLAHAPVYKISGRPELFSLAELRRMRTAGVPVFFSPLQANLRWLGGAFTRDYIILPPPCTLGGGAPGFYDDLFKAVFGEDVVNLDAIREDAGDKVNELVRRGIVDPRFLNPRCEVVGERGLTGEEARLAREIDDVLARPEIAQAIVRHLHLPGGRIRAAFFEVEEAGVTVATGLFNRQGDALAEPADAPPVRGEALPPRDPPPDPGDAEIRLGLCRTHPFVQRLLANRNPLRIYYALTFLANELAHCQKLLAPGSLFYHFTKERLAQDMRRALMRELLQVQA